MAFTWEPFHSVSPCNIQYGGFQNIFHTLLPHLPRVNEIMTLCELIPVSKSSDKKDVSMSWRHLPIRHRTEYTFPRYWPFVRGIHRSLVDSTHKGQWHGALMFSLISVWTNDWANNRDASDLRRHCYHYSVTVMSRNWVTICSGDGLTLFQL